MFFSRKKGGLARWKMETKKPPRPKAQGDEPIKQRMHGKRLFEEFSCNKC
jgi:hypothetical protein